MSLTNFIPQVWSAKLLLNLHKAHVYGNPLVINRDYEGEIKDFGDTVRINAIGTVTISNYTRNTDIAAAQVLDSAQTLLTINQAQYFNFAVDDVDKAQIKPQVMDAAMWEAGYGLADSTDTYIAGLIAGNVATANVIASSASPKTDLATSGKAYGYLVTMAQKLNEANVPQAGRWVVVPPWFFAWIQQDANFIHSTTAADILLRTGKLDPGIQANMAPDLSVGGSSLPTSESFVGYISGFAMFMSNNVPSVGGATSFQILAGHNMAWSFAEQIIKVEAYRPPQRFSDAVKGLHVYAAAIVRPQALALLYANPT